MENSYNIHKYINGPIVFTSILFGISMFLGITYYGGIDLNVINFLIPLILLLIFNKIPIKKLKEIHYSHKINQISLFLLSLLYILMLANQKYNLVDLYNGYVMDILSYFIIFSLFMNLYINDKENNIQEKQKFEFSKLLYIPFFLFAILKISILFLYNGSYIDEYYHIVSASFLIDEHSLPQFSDGIYYYRGIVVTGIVYLLFLFFGKSIFVAKFAPLIFGFISLFLLFKICKLFLNKFDTSILLTLYSIDLATMLNHFYIRFFAFYEMSLLLITYLWFNSLNSANENPTKKYKILLCLNIIFYLLTRDNGVYMLFFYSLSMSTLTLYYIDHRLYTKLKNKIKDLELRYKIYIIALLTVLISIVFYLLKLHDKVSELLYHTNQTVFKISIIGYNKIFFSYYLIFSIFILAHIPLVAKKIFETKKINSETILIASFLCIFLIHLITSKELQYYRTILYVFPLFYLVTFITIKNVIRETRFQFFFYTLFFFSIIIFYPKDIISIPTIPKESVYLGGDIYDVTKRNCKDSIIISSQLPYVLNFYNINPTYYLQENINKDLEDGYIKHDLINDQYFTTLDHKLIITDVEYLRKVINDSTTKICYFERTPVVNSYLDDQTKELIKNNFYLIFADRNLNLYVDKF